MNNSFASVYKDKRVIVTGHTGFKGSWLTLWLQRLGAKVTGISDRIPTTPSNFEASGLIDSVNDVRADLLDLEKIQQTFRECRPHFVFHLAAQALVKESYDNPIRTFQTNALGSVHLMEALKGLEDPAVAVMITSDKVYDNVEWVWGYRETDALGGKDPYSASKSMAEIAIKSYLKSLLHEKGTLKVGIGRAGNVIGGGDWAEARIVPDCVRAWSRGDSVSIRSPRATRPWQHVLEPLSGYLLLGKALAEEPNLHSEAFNFGPVAGQSKSVGDLILEMEKHWSNVRWEDLSAQGSPFLEAGLLKLNCDKALYHLDWLPTLQFEETVAMTVQWYREFYEGGDMKSYSVNQIDQYVHLARERGNGWAK
ncbi:MAG: CDP-glucose 4,6-dehydratase [Leptospiraceae bacterium]